VVWAKTRKYPRFTLQCPALIDFDGGGVMRKIQAETRNISLGGVLLTCDAQIPAGSKVGVELQLSPAKSPKPINLIAKGQVVRIEKRSPLGTFMVAIACEQPFSCSPYPEK